MFRKRRAVRQLSAEELKTKLYSHLDKNGSLNRMRTELRGKLVSELLKVAEPLHTSVSNESVADFDKALLPLQVSNWLVYDHLLRQGHQYALSVFVTEANLPQPERLLTACDILCLFGLDSTTPEYKSISRMYSATNEQSDFHSLLLAVIKSLFNYSDRDEKHSMTEVIEKELTDAHSKDSPKELSPKHFLLEEMPFCGGNVNKFHEKFAPGGRNESIEPALKEQLQLGIEKKENQNLRQKLLQELDRLHSQERTQQLEIENERLEIKKERAQLSQEKDKIREKELLMIKEYENKLERKIRELKTDFSSKLHSKEKSLEDLQRKLLEKEQRFSQMEVEFSSQRSSCDVLRKELEEMRNLYKSVKEKYSTLLDDNTNLLRKFESMSDYAVLKGELDDKSRQVSSLQKEIEDISKTLEKEKGVLTENVRNMETKLKAKESEVLEAQRQLTRMRDTLNMEEAMWRKEKKKLEQETLASRDMYKAFIERFEEQKDDIQALHQTIHLLHYQLTEKDARNSSKPEQFITRRAAFTVPEAARNQSEVFRINRNVKDSQPKYKESSLKFIEDAKNRIGKLQQEADALQDKCSYVYSSVPEFNSTFPMKPLAFNTVTSHFDSSISDNMKRFSTNLNNDHFKNLVGNEMPTLDLSLPANIRSQLASTFSTAYVPTTPKPSAVASYVAPSSNISNTSTKEVFTTELNKTVVSTKTLEPAELHLKNTVFVGDNYHLNAEDAERILPQLSNSKDLLISSTSKFAVTKGAISQTFNSTDNSTMSFKITQPQMLEKLTYDIPSTSEKESTTPKTYFPQNRNKTHEGDMLLRQTMLSEAMHGTLPSVEEMASRSSAGTIDSERLNRDVPPQALDDSVLDGASKSVTKDTGDSFNKVARDPEPSKTVPIVVDLDAAWKRKSSLVPSPYPSAQHTDLLKQPSLEEVSKNQSSKNTTLADVSETKLTSPENKSKESIHSSGDKNDCSIPSDSKLGHESADQNANHSESSERVQLELGAKDPDHQQHISKSIEEKQDSQPNEFVREGTSKPADAELLKNVESDVRPVHEDSLSELSEVHLSCGSEQEQQKEDSDNW